MVNSHTIVTQTCKKYVILGKISYFPKQEPQKMPKPPIFSDFGNHSLITDIYIFMKHLTLYLLFCCLSNIAWVIAQPIHNEMPDMTQFSGDKKGLTDLVQYLLASDRKTRNKMTTSLKPTQEDYETVFIEQDFAAKIHRYHRKLSNAYSLTIQPNLEGQTEMLLWEADVQQLKNYIGDAMYFPGGYKEIADKMNPDLHYFRFKYVQPGRSTGSSYDVLVYVNGAWRYFPRPWAANFKKQ